MLFALLVVLAGTPIMGRVVDADSNQPIAGARVMLLPAEQVFPPEATSPRETVTDTRGRFVFDAVAPGRYQINAQMFGFAPLADPPTLDITDAQAFRGVELMLKKGGEIFGRIVDASGAPLPSITVSVLTHAAGTPTRGITAQMAQTNDLGEFRLAGLADGDYVVIAAPPPSPPLAQPAVPSGAIMAPTYYPGTTSREAAQRISIVSGQTVNDVQFSMHSIPAYQISGVVVDEAGSPLSGAFVTLWLDVRDGGTGAAAMGRSDESGMFRIGGVVPGTYRLGAGLPTMWATRAGAAAAGSGGFVAVTGGVFVGGASVGGPGVAAPMGMPPLLAVTVDNADVLGLRVVVTTQR
jgi:protocatechuate 3,4-dioxygenase beta subunit